ncbi:MAG: hypothetical protein QW795_03525 [Candidatus Bathyarchaeia archaeon]
MEKKTELIKMKLYIKCLRCGRIIKYQKYKEHVKKERVKAEKEVIKFIKKEKIFCTRDLITLTKLSPNQVYKIIKKLENENKIKNVGDIWISS